MTNLHEIMYLCVFEAMPHHSNIPGTEFWNRCMKNR